MDNFEPIADPAERATLKAELIKNQLLGQTSDGKQIYLVDATGNDTVMHEIGRLREITFREVGEGTGKALDLDDYDSYYRQLVLWDEDDHEIAGAYRIGEAGRIIAEKGRKGLYVSELFDLNDALMPRLEQGIELGRSFVQPKYWGRRSLDYLWFGLGAYWSAYPGFKYFFGPLSLSVEYPMLAQELIVGFHHHYFGTQGLATAKRPVTISDEAKGILKEIPQDEYKDGFKQLNKTLKEKFEVTVPTLFKQYVDLCEMGGVEFLDFSIDPDFNHCIDGLITLEIAKMKPKKFERYSKGAEGL